MTNPDKKIETIIQNWKSITESDISYILSSRDITKQNILFEQSKVLKNAQFGNNMLKKAKICISSYCTQNCKHCICNGQNDNFNRYRLGVDTIIDLTKKISSSGIKTIILNSGVDDFFNTDMVSHIIYMIKTQTDVNVTVALCEREKEEYISWAIAGADNYLFPYGLNDKYINFENIKDEKDLNKFSEFQSQKINVSVELIVGVPEQKNEEIAKILFMLKYNNIESLIITPYTVFANTRVNDNEILDLTHRTIAAARLVMPEKNIFSHNAMFSKSAEEGIFGNNGLIFDFSTSTKNYIKLVNTKKKGKLSYS